MRSHDELLRALAAWDPDRDDLPDDVALALDDSAELRAAFDARFEPPTLAAPDAPAGLAGRVMPGSRAPAALAPPPRRTVPWRALGLLAAAGLTGVVLAGTFTLRAGRSPDVQDFMEVSMVVAPAGPANGLTGGQAAPSHDPAPTQLAPHGYVLPDDDGVADGKSGGRYREGGGGESATLQIVRGDRVTTSDATVAVRKNTETKPAVDRDLRDANDGVDGQPAVHREAPTGPTRMVRVADDPLSTFSVDVDTGSYTYARRVLRSGHLPAPDGVRVEEFVNYFPYDYAPPAPGEPFAVRVEGAPSPWNPGRQLVRIGLQAHEVPADQRKPAHLTLLVDTSGSMQSDDKLGLVKQTLRLLTEELGDGDTVAIVAYAGSAGVVLEPTPMSRKADVLRAIDRLTAGGSTAMGAGIELAYALAAQQHREGATSRVIICSDGDANVGATDPDALTRLLRGHADRGITLTTVGFGDGNYRDPTMERLADQGDGNYHYVDSLAEARRVFVDRLTSTMEVVARDVKLQVAWDPSAVEAWRLVGYENRAIADRDFRNDAVDAGEVGAGHQVTALYELLLVDGAKTPLGTLRLRSEAPGPQAPAVERSFPLPRSALRPSLSEAGADLRLATSAAWLAVALRDDVPVAWDDLQALASGARRAEYPEDGELVELIGRARALRGR